MRIKKKATVCSQDATSWEVHRHREALEAVGRCAVEAGSGDVAFNDPTPRRNLRAVSRLLPTFADRALQRRFRQDGFVCVPLRDPDIPQRIRAVETELGAADKTGAWSSLHLDPDARRAAIDDRVTAILWPDLAGRLHDHRPLIASLSLKASSGTSTFPVHQDWTTMDERRGLGITCWLPVTPIGPDEGLLRVAPGSHRVVACLRGSPHFPTPFDDVRDEIERDHMVSVAVPVGHVVIMAGRTLHMSGQNRSGATRIAVTLSAIPSEAEAVHYFREDDGTVSGYGVGPEFFRTLRIGDRPSGEPFEVLPGYEPDPIDLDRLRRARRRWRVRHHSG